MIIWFLEIGHDLAEDVSDRRAEGDQNRGGDSQCENQNNNFLKHRLKIFLWRRRG